MMAALPNSYDPRDFDPDTRPEPFAEGRYRFMILGTDVKRTKAGDGSFLAVEHEVQGGPFNGRKFFNQITLENPSVQAVEIGQKQLSALCHAVGYLQPLVNSDVLHGRTGEVEVGIEPGNTVNGKTYGPKNSVKRYVLPEAAGKASVQQSAARQADPPAKAASGSRPWAKTA